MLGRSHCMIRMIYHVKVQVLFAHCNLVQFVSDKYIVVCALNSLDLYRIVLTIRKVYIKVLIAIN